MVPNLGLGSPRRHNIVKIGKEMKKTNLNIFLVFLFFFEILDIATSVF